MSILFNDPSKFFNKLLIIRMQLHKFKYLYVLRRKYALFIINFNKEYFYTTQKMLINILIKKYQSM